jgi:hypothetical protein
LVEFIVLVKLHLSSREDELLYAAYTLGMIYIMYKEGRKRKVILPLA